MKAKWKPKPFLGHQLLVDAGDGRVVAAYATKSGSWFWTCIACENSREKDRPPYAADLCTAQERCLTNIRTYLEQCVKGLGGTVTWKDKADV